jgi:predicted metal-dependent phosphoesterase TrpH
MMKLDLHIHSSYSEDGDGSPKEIIKILKKRGFQGMSITDHNTLDGSLRAMKIAPKDFLVIPGVEISTLDGHLIALNIKEPVEKKLTIQDTVDRVIDLGGIPIVPHLFRNLSGIKKEKLMEISSKLSAIEVFNSCSTPQTNLKTAKIAKELKIGGTGGSDAHEPEYVGFGYTTINNNDLKIDSIISEINKHKTWGEGNVLPFSYRQDRMIKSMKQFFQRGLKRI